MSAKKAGNSIWSRGDALRIANDRRGSFVGDCVAKLKNEGAPKFRNLSVEMNFRQYDAL
jgi:hypothetical protein